MLKRSVRSVIGTVAPYVWRRRRRALVVLMYHRVLPDSQAAVPTLQPGMVVTEKTFAMQLSVLRQHFEPISLGAWLEDAQNGRALPARACAITFDDGWRDNYDYAFPLLKQAAMPATIFVVSDLVGTNLKFWPERLANVLWHRGSGLPQQILDTAEFAWIAELRLSFRLDQAPTRENIDEAIAAAKMYPDALLHERISAMQRVTGMNGTAKPDMLDWDQLREMSASGIEVGSHTRHHVRLADHVGSRELHDEVVGSADVIQRNCKIRPRLFCYPNGDRSKAAEALVRQNYIGACVVRRGWNTHRSDPYVLQRIGIHEGIASSRAKFLARLSGWV